jgi:lipoprotein-releasing system permease protein
MMSIRLHVWMVLRYLGEGRRFLSLNLILAVLGVALGVAALVIAMAVVSGYESTLRTTVVNMQGHVVILKHGGIESERGDLEKKVQASVHELQAMTPFLVIEGLIVHQKKLSGVALEGVDPGTVGFVLSLEHTLTEGDVRLGASTEGAPPALIGRGLSRKFGLHVGDEFRLVIPITRTRSQEGFRPKAQKFRVGGILDLGRADYDERYILTDLVTAQKFGELPGRISGWRLRLEKDDQAVTVAQRVERTLGASFWTRTWVDANRNLFQAVRYEKVIIFIVVMLMVVAAAFNVASTLFLSVVRRYSQIGILKAMGVSGAFIQRLFTVQGLLVGAAGTMLGLVLGLLGCQAFLWAEKKYSLFPGEVYKLNFVQLEVRWEDLSVILIVALFFCYLSALAPAKRGAQLLPVEGLRYE